MPVRLDRSSADFAERFAEFLAMKREVSADIESATRAIVDDVAARGDAALIEATRKFDRLDLDAGGLRVTAAEIDAAVKACDARRRSMRSNSRATGSRFFTGGNCRRTIASPMRWASNSAGAGARSKRSGFMCRAAPPPIRPRC